MTRDGASRILRCAAGLLLLALLGAVAPARAGGSSGEATPAGTDEEASSEAAPARWKLEGGAGTALRPVRRGDNRYIFSPFPLARLSYGDLFEASTRDGISYAVLAGEDIKVGPELEIDRKERPSTRRLGPVATTFGTGGVGAFAEWKLGAEARLRFDMTEGVFGREGLRVVLSGARSFTLAEPVAIEWGLKGVGGDRRYVTSAYGIPESRKAFMLPSAVPNLRHGSAGATALGPTMGVSYAASDRDSVVANVEISRVLGTASHTPAVRNLGTRNAMSVELSWRRTLFEGN